MMKEKLIISSSKLVQNAVVLLHVIFVLKQRINVKRHANVRMIL